MTFNNLAGARGLVAVHDGKCASGLVAVHDSNYAPGLVAAHVAVCSPGVRKVLKSAWEVEAVPPGVADHITLGIAARAGLVAAHVAV